ncbi:MAG: amidohydrolase family protein [Hyphomicrobiaceae bacterium]
MASSLNIVDFHCHHVPAAFEVTATSTAPPTQRLRWERTAKLISDETLLLADIESGDISARIVNAPAAQIADASGQVAHETIMRVNDEMAALASRHPGRIVCLATIDAYVGEQGACELERAVTTLGLRGAFVDCARADLLIDAPQARPVLAAAAQLGVPVFVHPVNPQPLTAQMEPYGRIGTLFARGTVNAAALIALIEGGVFAELPELKVVVTALAFGGLAMAGGFSHMSRLPEGTGDVLRRNVFVDTMGFHPALIRAAVDLVGASNVVAGSDWPIVNEGPIRSYLEQALAAAGLDAGQQAMIAAGNARRLVGLA